jgi:hypothetical protein
VEESTRRMLKMVKTEVKKRFEKSDFNVCRNLWALLFGLSDLAPYHTKDTAAIFEIIDEELRYCVYH